VSRPNKNKKRLTLQLEVLFKAIHQLASPSKKTTWFRNAVATVALLLPISPESIAS
jgi:hypothetical protein